MGTTASGCLWCVVAALVLAAAGLAHPWASFDMSVVLQYLASTLHEGESEAILMLKRVLTWMSGIDGVSNKGMKIRLCWSCHSRCSGVISGVISRRLLVNFKQSVDQVSQASLLGCLLGLPCVCCHCPCPTNSDPVQLGTELLSILVLCMQPAGADPSNYLSLCLGPYITDYRKRDEKREEQIRLDKLRAKGRRVLAQVRKLGCKEECLLTEHRRSRELVLRHTLQSC